MNAIIYSIKLTIIYEQNEESEIEQPKIQTQEVPEWPSIDFGD